MVKKSWAESSDVAPEGPEVCVVTPYVVLGAAEAWRLSMSRDIIVIEMLLAAVERHPRRRGYWLVGILGQCHGDSVEKEKRTSRNYEKIV